MSKDTYPKYIVGWQASDGTIHASLHTAENVQHQLDFAEWLASECALEKHTAHHVAARTCEIWSIHRRLPDLPSEDEAPRA